MALTKVSTDGVKDDAITSGKIPANAVGASELADNAVDTNAIANNAVTAGKTSGVQTTINNNADNRVITGSGTANTLNAESGVVIDSSGRLLVGTTTDNGFKFKVSDSGGFEFAFAPNDSGVNNLVNYNRSGNAYVPFQVSGSDLRFGSGGNTERMRIDSSGAVGIGTVGGTYSLELENKINSDVQLSIKNNVNGEDTGIRIVAQHGGSTRTSNIGHSVITNGTGLQVGSQDNIVFYTGFNTLSERVRIDDNGMKFNGDTAAANALDDYEEGTFTPNIQGTGSNNSKTYTQQKGKYTKIGNIVHCEFRIAWSNAAVDSGSAIVNGLPFVIDNATNLDTGAAIGSMACNNLNFVNGDVITAAWEAANGQQYVYFLVTYDNAGWNNPSTGIFNNTGNVRGSVTYRVA